MTAAPSLPPHNILQLPPPRPELVPTAPALPVLIAEDHEQIVLGGLLSDFDGAILRQVRPILHADDFGLTPRHTTIYNAILAVADREQVLDLSLVAAELERKEKIQLIGGTTYLIECMNRCPTGAVVPIFAKSVAEYAERRRLLAAASSAARAAHDLKRPLTEVRAEVQADIHDAIAHTGSQQWVTSGQAIHRLTDEIEAGITAGVPTGFGGVDKYFRRGLTAGKYWILAGRPGMGKSALALRIARNAAQDGIGVAYFTFEMSPEDNDVRLVSEAMRMPIDEVYALNAEHPRWPEYLRAAAEVHDLPIFYHETADTPDALEAALFALMARENIGLVVIDHVHLMTIDGATVGEDTAAITAISKRMRRLAKTVPVMLLSQLNRGVEARANKEPMMADLRQSGSLEQDADVILMLYRAHYYDNSHDESDVKLFIRKNRQGATATVPMFFVPKFTAFYDISTRKE